MDNKTTINRLLKNYGLIFGIFSLYILLRILQIYFRNMHSTIQQPYGETIALLALWGYLWALFTPFIAWLARRFIISRQHLLKNLLLQFCFGILFATLHRLLTVFLVHNFAPTSIRIPPGAVAQIFYFLHFISDGFFDYLLIMAIVQAIIYFSEVQQREFRLQQAELQALKTQLQPHFLFNTLNAISALSFDAPEVASRVIAQLSDLLRFSLKSGRAEETTLKEELDFVRKYLQIQQILLQERLQTEWEIAPDTLDACVPNMFLQPLVENSIRHGIAPKESGGCIKISSRKIGDTLEIRVGDDGLGFTSEDSETDGGIGLANTRARLRHLYGEAQKFELNQPSSGGVIITITMPFREGNKNQK